MSCAKDPALLAIFAPFPGTSSKQEIIVPRGMTDNGIALPKSGLTLSVPEITFCPTFRPDCATIYLFSPSGYLISAINEDLFGSYSIETISPGVSYLSLLKSIILYFFIPH